jgi:hypothetical protein
MGMSLHLIQRLLLRIIFQQFAKTGTPFPENVFSFGVLHLKIRFHLVDFSSMKLPAASGRGILGIYILFAASGGEFTQRDSSGVLLIEGPH